jgi:hypothetical protein
MWSSRNVAAPMRFSPRSRINVLKKWRHISARYPLPAALRLAKRKNSRREAWNQAKRTLEGE